MHRLFVLFAALLFCVGPAAAQSGCKEVKLSEASVRDWFVPSPPPADAVTFPLSVRWNGESFAAELAFTPIPFPETGMFPTERSVFTMGSDYPEPFENSMKARVASPLGQARGAPQLLLGTFEVSLGQAAVMLGEGDLAQGLEKLAAASGDPDLKPVRRFADPQDACHGRVTRELVAALRLPAAFLKQEDYLATVRSLTMLCGREPACGRKLKALGGARGGTAFFRLPQEHEWEFAARGAYSYVKGDLTAQDLQLQLPPLPSGGKFKAYAHADSTPPRLLPIGARKLLHGFYDLFGNAQELMANPFTSEAGSGAVGGALARGGSFRTALRDMRTSRRTELSVYQRNEATGLFAAQSFPTTGMRLAVGAPVLSAFSVPQLQAEFLKSYVSVDELGDAAGDSPETARDIGALANATLELNDEVGGPDQADVYGFEVGSYGALAITVEAGDKALIQLLDGAGAEWGRSSLRANVQQDVRFSGLLPGQRYYLRIAPRLAGADSLSYRTRVRLEAEPDTGIAQAGHTTVQYAQEIRKGVAEYRGYVGADDMSDIYPFRMEAAAGGLAVRLAEHRAPLRIVLRDSGGKSLREELAAPASGGETLLIPAAKGVSGFVEVAMAKGNLATAYSLQLSPAAISDDIFAAALETAGEAQPDRSYSGTLGGDIRVLHVKFKLARPSEVQARLYGLTADTEMRVVTADGIDLPDQNYRSGVRDKIFKRILPAGTYAARISLPASAGAGSSFTFAYGAETRSTKDLDQRQLAVSETVILQGDSQSYRIEVPANAAARYISYTPESSGIRLFKLNFPRDHKMAMVLESASGERRGIASSGDVYEGVKYTVTGGQPLFLYITRRGARLDKLDLELTITDIREELAAVATLFGGKPVVVQGAWVVFDTPDKCMIASLAASSAATEKPVLFFGFIKNEPSYFTHSLLSFQQASTHFQLFAVTGKKEKRLDIVHSDKNVMYLRKPCDSNPDGCFDRNIARQVASANRLKFVAGKTEIEFDMTGYSAAVREAATMCQATPDSFVK